MKKTTLFFISCLAIVGVTNAQMVGSNAYMKGNYVEIGINGAGGFEGVDTAVSVPFAGLHYRSNTQYFGFVANPQMDGWVNYDGDFYSPGSPENGWGFEIFDTTSTDTINFNVNNNMASTGSGFTGAITSYSYAAGYTNVVWEGNYALSGYDIDFTLSYTLGDNDLFYTTDVTIFNNGPANIEKFYFFRNIDPDNNITLTGTYTTTNTIINQVSTGCCYSSVKAEQSFPWYSLFAFYTSDSNSRVCYGGFTNRDGSDLWNGTGFVQTIGSTNFADEAVSLIFEGTNFVSFTKASGGSPTLHYKYYTVLGQSALSELITTTNTTEIETMEVKIYPNPANDFISVSSNENIKQITVHNAFGQIVYRDTNLNSNATQINTSGFSTGMYYITLQGENSAVVKKVIKK